MLHAFDKRLLEFIYRLTLHKKLMNSREMAQNITIRGKKVSERTIKRWLKHLRENHYFTYHLSIKFERLGLSSLALTVYGLRNPALLDVIPYKIYLMKGVDFRTHQECFFVNYKIPNEMFQEFCNFWRDAKSRKLIEDFTVFKVKHVTALYSPFHEMISSNGTIKAIKTCDDRFINLLKDNLHNERKTKFSAPFVVLTAAEYLKDFASPRKIWERLNEKFGEDVCYLPKKCPSVKGLKIRKNTIGVGVSCIQQVLKYLHENSEDFLQQIRIAYGPLYRENINLQFILKLKDEQTLLELIRTISKKSLHVVVYCLDPRNLFTIELVTNGKLVADVFMDISKAMLKTRVNRAILFDYADSSNFWEGKTKGWLKQHYHKLFDPKTTSWKYDSRKYLQELDRLSVKSRE